LPVVSKIRTCTSCRFQKNGCGRTHGHSMSPNSFLPLRTAPRIITHTFVGNN
jgi:hypothetical protein